jgi:opacity protein-like surface antigen
MKSRAGHWLAAIAGVFAMALSLSPSPASARDDDDYGRAYIVLGGLTAFPTFKDLDPLSFDTSLGFQFRGGYRFNRIFALEGGVDFVSGWDSQLLPVIEGGNVTVNGLAYFPMGRFEPYALIGLGGMWTSVRPVGLTPPGSCCGGFVMKFGGGSDFYVTDDWALTVDVAYVLPVGSIENLRYVSLGWGARFHF